MVCDILIEYLCPAVKQWHGNWKQTVINKHIFSILMDHFHPIASQSESGHIWVRGAESSPCVKRKRFQHAPVTAHLSQYKRPLPYIKQAAWLKDATIVWLLLHTATWQRTTFSPGIHGRLAPQYVLCFPKVIIRIYSSPSLCWHIGGKPMMYEPSRVIYLPNSPRCGAIIYLLTNQTFQTTSAVTPAGAEQCWWYTHTHVHTTWYICCDPSRSTGTGWSGYTHTTHVQHTLIHLLWPKPEHKALAGHEPTHTHTHTHTHTTLIHRCDPSQSTGTGLVRYTHPLNICCDPSQSQALAGQDTHTHTVHTPWYICCDPSQSTGTGWSGHTTHTPQHTPDTSAVTQARAQALLVRIHHTHTHTHTDTSAVTQARAQATGWSGHHTPTHTHTHTWYICCDPSQSTGTGWSGHTHTHTHTHLIHLLDPSRAQAMAGQDTHTHTHTHTLIHCCDPSQSTGTGGQDTHTHTHTHTLIHLWPKPEHRHWLVRTHTHTHTHTLIHLLWPKPEHRHWLVRITHNTHTHTDTSAVTQARAQALAGQDTHTHTQPHTPWYICCDQARATGTAGQDTHHTQRLMLMHNKQYAQLIPFLRYIENLGLSCQIFYPVICTVSM